MMPDITMHHDKTHHHKYCPFESMGYVMSEAKRLISGRSRYTYIKHHVTNDDFLYIRDCRHQAATASTVTPTKEKHHA